MYDNNPTLSGIKKEMDENRQGEVFFDALTPAAAGNKQFYIESYGCQMNFSDSEIVASILAKSHYMPTRNVENANLILINTCSIREKAEETVRNRLRAFSQIKKQRPDTMIGVLGCMAERLKKQFLEEEKLVDLVVGPDAYRDLPSLVATVEEGQKGINVLLSREETYSDISPVRLDGNGVTAFISIMRGCDNMCSFCVVPFTRGRERSRDVFSIVAEARQLFEEGYREVTLLGQNVDSYKWENPETGKIAHFSDLLEMVALVDPNLRVRFSTSHPKDITDEVLLTMAKYENICKYIHLPVQSGNSRILELMNRTYDREWYMQKINRIYEIMPECAISSDIITGFCSETEAEHQDSLSIIRFARYSMSYMFCYSERPGTLAARKLADDVPQEIKSRRLEEVITVQREISHQHNLADIGKTFKVLIEGDSKKSNAAFKGRNSQNKMIVFPKIEGLKKGDYCWVKKFFRALFIRFRRENTTNLSLSTAARYPKERLIRSFSGTKKARLRVRQASAKAFLLRLLESGEFIRVGASKVQKTNVRVIAATNVDLLENVRRGRFREDLYYRLNTVPIRVPALKDRPEDINLLFRKFAHDFAEKYRTTPIQLEPEAQRVLENYRWPGNIRELKNLAEQVSVLAQDKMVSAQELTRLVPNLLNRNLPMVSDFNASNGTASMQEREILYKLLFDMKNDLNDLKSLVFELIRSNNLNVSDVQQLKQLQAPGTSPSAF
ncbi:unnamed protein product, partial [Darwinula stevensoni]